VNRNQLNEVREAEYIVGVEVIWRDLRTGEILSNRRPRIDPPPVPFDPQNIPADPPVLPPAPVLVQAVGRMLPEVGESTATALQMAMDRLAIQIVSMMEKPW
jgi:hypothetical protein